MVFLVFWLKTNVCLEQYQSASYLDSFMEIIVLGFLQPLSSLSYGLQLDYPLMVSSGHSLVMNYYNTQERICKFPHWQYAPVAGLCVGIFLFAMLRKENISFPVVSLQNYLLVPLNFSMSLCRKIPLCLASCCVFCVVPWYPEI